METAKTASSGRPGNAGLLELIRAKREYHWRPSAMQLRQGFRGWHQRGYLPHFDAPGVTQFVTFQLGDALPAERRREWGDILHELDPSEKRRRLEIWLDRGHGRCLLRQPEAADLVERVLLQENGHDYRLLAWVIMPNHVHLVVEIWDIPLAKLIGGWKGVSARKANTLQGSRGKFWLEDYYDTLIRDEAHLKRAVRYTEQNPVKAFLARTARDWRWGSARHRDEYERLPWQRPKQDG